MLDQPFEVNGVLGKVKRRNAAMTAFEGALYTKKLYKVYPGVSEDLRTALSMNVQTNEGVNEDGTKKADDLTVLSGSEIIRPDIQASLVMSGYMTDFCTNIAPRITDFDGDSVKWVRAQVAKPEQVDAMFQFWLEREDFREEVAQVIEAMDFPNGKEGSSAGLLTATEQQNPLSAALVPNGATN